METTLTGFKPLMSMMTDHLIIAQSFEKYFFMMESNIIIVNSSCNILF